MSSTAAAVAVAARRKPPGLSIAVKLMLTFLGVIFVLGTLLVVVYQHYVPGLVQSQIELRVESVTRAFASAALPAVVERNYLRINKIAEATAKLPDVAYAAAVNDRGIAVAGIFGDLGKFNPHFSALVEQQGFPREIVEQGRLEPDLEFRRHNLDVGGQRILSYTLRLPNTGAEVQVGLFTSEVEKALRATLLPLLTLLGAMAVVGTIALILVAGTVSRPIRQLSEQAELISMGQLDREIDIRAGGEIWQLAESFKRMQASIRYSIHQMRRQPPR